MLFLGTLPKSSADTTGDVKNVVQQTQDDKKAKKSFLRSLLCCLGGNKSKNQNSGAWLEDSSYSIGSIKYLLPPVRHQDMHKKCMVIDLDETLVHSSFKVNNN